jgi:hypothetical protein
MSKKTIERTTSGLRTMMMNELEDYLNGLNTTERMNTVSKATTAVCRTIVVDLEARKMLERMNAGKDIPQAIANLNLNLSI